MPDGLSPVQSMATWICNQISLTLSSAEWSCGTLGRWCCRKSFQNRDRSILFHCWTILIDVNLSVNMWRAWANSVCKFISQICLEITRKSRDLIKPVLVLPSFPPPFLSSFLFLDFRLHQESSGNWKYNVKYRRLKKTVCWMMGGSWLDRWGKCLSWRITLSSYASVSTLKKKLST